MIKLSVRTFLHRLSQLRYLSHKKVDFIVIGAQKSGTSSLRDYLNRHHDIRMSYTKEPHFFDGPLYTSSSLSYYWYEKDFYQGDHSKTLGEVTPILSYLPEAPQRIKTYNPAIKLIMILRNPIDRAYSHWNMEIERGNEDQEFAYCIAHEHRRLSSSDPKDQMYRSYIDRGYYAAQVKRLQDLFQGDQLLFLKYEDYVSHQETTIHEILEFLNLPIAGYQYESRTVHKRSYVRPLAASVRKLLRDRYKSDITELEHLLNWDCTDWKTK